MGKPIVYCVNCGQSLREDDFLRRLAWMVDNRPWCASCKPLPPESRRVATPSPGRRSSGQIPVPPSTPRRPLPAPRPTSRAPLIAGTLITAAVVATIAVLMPGSSAPTRAPAAPTSAAPDPAARAVEELERFAAGGGDPRAVLARAQAARPIVAATPHESRLKAVEDRARATLESALPAGDATDRYIAMIRELRERDVTFRRRAEAKNLIAATRRQAGARAGEIDRLEADYDRAFEDAARAAADTAAAEARALAAKGQTPEAVARLDDVPKAFADTPPVRNLASLREELLRVPAPVPEKPAAEGPAAVVLTAGAAKLKSGGGLAFKNGDYLGNWHADADAAEWMVAPPAAGRWNVELVYAASPTAGGTFVVTLGAAKLEWDVVPTGSFKTFKTVGLGAVPLRGEATTVLARGKGVRKDGLLNLREIRLTPAP
ncbi:MAG TPA: hypothetical protein VF950_08610 [Planctomycetota bacterium]